MSGPLTGVRVLEAGGIGPGPFAAMLLADLGVDVVRVDRPADRFTSHAQIPVDLLRRGRRSVGLDLKQAEGLEALLRLVDRADVLIEGFRPGVAERLGFGPDACLARNQRLIYGRMTGFGRDGEFAHLAGHDINYISVAGVLSQIGEAGRAPIPPLNLVGDFGGGGLMLAFGIASALVDVARSGTGQVVDAAMVDGAALLATLQFGLFATGHWVDERGHNNLDGSTPYYRTYETADGQYMAVGAAEPQFFANLLLGLGLDADPTAQRDQTRWPELAERCAAAFRQRTQAEWTKVFTEIDACVTPVLSLAEALSFPHNRTRETFVEVDGVAQPAPAPRFSKTPGAIRMPPPEPCEHTEAVLHEWGFETPEIEALLASGAAAGPA